jgi:beta-glucosidase
MRMGEGRTEAAPEFPFRDPGLALDERARDLVSRLGLDEKIGMMASRQTAVPRLGIEEFHIGGEAAHGYVTKDGPTTSFPQTIGLSCSWDADLLYLIGARLGDEARAYYHKRRRLGGICLFAPTIDMERDPRWGRTEEAYGEDPKLAGELSGSMIRGMQGDHPFYLKAAATPKHFYANNNESRRASCSASIDPRTRHEYYLAAFRPAVAEAKAASLMTSYNAINGVPAMLHPDLQEVVKGDWGLEGFVVCDGGALSLLVSEHKRCANLEEAVALSIKAGVDNFSDDAEVVIKALKGALERKLIDETAIDSALFRVFKIRIRLGQFDPPGLDPYASIDQSILWGEGAKQLALRAARESIVLLSNGSASRPGGPGLPLDAKKLRSLAVLGPLADIAYRDWYSGISSYRVTPYQALCARLPGVAIRYSDGSDIVSFRAPDGNWLGVKAWYNSELTARRPPASGGEQFRRCDWGWGNQTFRSLTSGSFITTDDQKLKVAADEVWGWFVKERFALEGAGLAEEPNAVRMRTWKNDPVGFDAEGALVVKRANPHGSGDQGDPLVMEKIRDGLAEALEAAKASEAAIVFLGNHPLLNGKEEIDRPSIALPPEQERLAEAAVAVNPRTVVVIVGSYPYALGAWREKAAAVLYAPHGGQEAGNALADVLLGASNPSGRCSMTWYSGEDELGDIMDYDIVRKGTTYLHHRGRPLYPFGHGMGYSPFEYSGMRLSSATLRRDGEIGATLRIRNKGGMDGAEVVQLYVSYPGSKIRRPEKQLVDFRRVSILAGAVAEVRLVLKARDLEAWDQEKKAWFLEEGECLLSVGASSADFRLQKKLRLEGSPVPVRSPYRWIAADEFDDIEGLILAEGQGGSSCLKRRWPGDGQPGYLLFDRMNFGAGGSCRFEAIASGSAESGLALSFPEARIPAVAIKGPEATSPASLASSMVLPVGEGRMKIEFFGDVSLHRFRFLVESA